jgi:hypothetical protein
MCMYKKINIFREPENLRLTAIAAHAQKKFRTVPYKSSTAHFQYHAVSLRYLLDWKVELDILRVGCNISNPTMRTGLL